MTVKEASAKFSKSPDTIRSICRLSKKENINYIKASKINGRWKIDDNTDILLTKTEIKYVLFQILKYKNNSNHAISFRNYNNPNSLQALMRYLSNIGFISIVHNDKNGLQLDNVMLTDEGFGFILPQSISNETRIVNIINLFSFEPTIGIRVA